MLCFVNLKELPCFLGNIKIVYSESNMNDHVPGHVIQVILSDITYSALPPPPKSRAKRLTNYNGETFR